MPDRSSRQRAEATRGPGGIDLDRLADLVGAADDGRHRTDRPGAPTAEEVRQAHARLLEALEVVPEGLVLLNAEGQCVFFNQHFLEIYDIAPDKIAVGAYFFDAVRVGLERGLYLDAIGREEEWLAERAEQIGKDRSSTEQHLSGDRWVRIEERRTADGGSIGIRIDITDLKRREEALKRRSDQLLEAQRLGQDRRLELHGSATRNSGGRRRSTRCSHTIRRRSGRARSRDGLCQGGSRARSLWPPMPRFCAAGRRGASTSR